MAVWYPTFRTCGDWSSSFNRWSSCTLCPLLTDKFLLCLTVKNIPLSSCSPSSHGYTSWLAYFTRNKKPVGYFIQSKLFNSYFKSWASDVHLLPYNNTWIAELYFTWFSHRQRVVFSVCGGHDPFWMLAMGLYYGLFVLFLHFLSILNILFASDSYWVQTWCFNGHIYQGAEN